MYTKKERIATTRKYIADALNRKDRRARAAAKITELDDGKEPPYRGVNLFTTSAMTKYLGDKVDVSKLTGYMVCFAYYVENELFCQKPWEDPTPYPEHLDKDLARYLQPLFYEHYDEAYLNVIIDDLISDLPERLRDDAHRNALKVIRALYDEIRCGSIEETFVDLTKLRIA